MGEYRFLVFSNPIEGREEEYEDWYTNRHVADVVRTAGFVCGQRFKLSGEGPHRYLALYEGEGDDPAASLAALQEAMKSGALPMSDAFDFSTTQAMVFEAHSPRITG